ncbi:diaminobutyrate--2-oxoglutarate transaminase [Mucilaginibacter antarcticus]|uniref:Diaminobutyrate--2-oxoglutarate transaminase n=1 Tax=Mucilaginibacter antarcticus TaxID=1855725 RepID=A0ABW5XN13_9SPHI
MLTPTSEAIEAQDLAALGLINTYPGELRQAATGPNNSAYLERQASTESNARSYPRKLTFAISKAKGMYIKDTDDNVYYDCLSGAGALALGHNHPVVQDAIRQQLDANLPMLTLDITTPVKDEFVQELLSSLPAEFAKNAKIQFCGPSGADAVEAAIKLVKIATGRRGMMAFHGGYHGMTHGALAMMGNLGSKSKIPGLMPEVQFLPFPYTYRSPMGDDGTACSELCSNYIDNILTDDESGVVKPAGIIIEAVQGEGGKIPASADFLQRLRKITKEQNIPLIIDEVQTGIGRTGKMYAFEHAGIIPDVVILSKAVGGSLPLAVVVYHKDLDVWGPGAHAGTFRGNQLAMATGTAVIRHIREHKLIENAAAMGQLFTTLLANIQLTKPCLGDIRGLGLMLGVEIVNPYSQETLCGKPPRYEQLSRRIQAACFSRGLILELGGRQSSVLRFMPPLTVNERQVRAICAIFEEAVTAAELELLPHQN